MVRVADLLLSFLIMAGARADRALDCSAICGAKMTFECCECIGCHQGMRFGKRSAPFYQEDRYNDEDENNIEIPRIIPRLSRYGLIMAATPIGGRVYRLRRRFIAY